MAGSGEARRRDGRTMASVRTRSNWERWSSRWTQDAACAPEERRPESLRPQRWAGRSPPSPQQRKSRSRPEPLPSPARWATRTFLHPRELRTSRAWRRRNRRSGTGASGTRGPSFAVPSALHRANRPRLEPVKGRRRERARGARRKGSVGRTSLSKNAISATRAVRMPHEGCQVSLRSV